MSISKWGAASKAVSQGLEFGFGFNSVDMASPVSGLQDRPVAQQSLRAASSRWFQTGPLPVLTSQVALPRSGRVLQSQGAGLMLRSEKRPPFGLRRPETGFLLLRYTAF